MPDSPETEFYLGDGVYARHDGAHLWLRVDDAEIALEPSVFANLVEFEPKLRATAAEKIRVSSTARRSP
jgi:hypothetical protein